MNKNMRFLLQLLGASALTTGAGITAVACSNNNITAPNVSTGIVIDNISIEANSANTYSDLNTDMNLTSAVANAINVAKNVSVIAGTDFIITNDQNGDSYQTVGATVEFHVIAISNQITGDFSFAVTLSKADISTGVTIADPLTQALPGSTYGSLNTRRSITNLVLTTINSKKNLKLVSSDISITNDQVATNNQVVGTKVTFTVQATGINATGSFTFTDTLGQVNIATGVTVTDLKTAANLNGSYNDLNTNQSILNAAVSAINTSKMTNITTSDISLTNNQSGLQTVGQPVTFIVNAVGSQITGSFSFIDTLSQVSIATGVTVPDPLTQALPSATYAALNNHIFLITKVVNAINAAKGTSISNSDIILTNDQVATANQVVGTVVTFTVTASNTSNQITGSFTFTDTLGKVSINGGVIIPDPKTTAVLNATYSSLNTNTALVNNVVTAINTARGTNITASDITLTNDQVAANNQVVGKAITFTVSANTNSNLIQGSFQFVNTLAKPDITTGINVADLLTPITITGNYTTLNTNTTVLNAVIAAINTAKGTSVTANDFTLSNNQTGFQVPGTPITFTVTANASSTQITGSFTFVDTLGKLDLSTISPNFVFPQRIPPDTTKTYAALNTANYIVNPVNAGIQNAIGYSPTLGVDYTLVNNLSTTTAQTYNTTVTFTMQGIGNRFTGALTFSINLLNVDLSVGVSVPDLKTPANSASTVGALMVLPIVTNAIANYISIAKGGVPFYYGIDFGVGPNTLAVNTATYAGLNFVINVYSNNSNKCYNFFNFSDVLS